ncbi:adenylate/guanylate cyclase domain-containing protein [soil metagenome]
MDYSTLSRDKSGVSSLVPWVFAGLCFVIAALLSLTPAWKLVEFKLLDALMVASAPNKSKFPITIIGIDDPSFAELKMQWPWPRRIHAEMIDQLVAAGAALIVFDVVFAEASKDPDDDKYLAEAIKRAGNVILVADRKVTDAAAIKLIEREDPAQKFVDAGAQVGYARVVLDADQIVRQVPNEAADSLWRTVTLRMMSKRPEIKANPNLPPGSLIRYVGPDHTFPYVPYHHVYNGTGGLPKDFFKDSVVIIGRNVATSVDIQNEQSDLFGTPFFGSTSGKTPGAELHANIIETALSNNAITPLPTLVTILLLAFAAAASAFSMRRWQPAHSLAVASGLIALIAASVWIAFFKLALWIPALSMVVVIALMYISIGSWQYLTERARAREIRQAFSLFVTPQVVNHLIAHPEQIKLGGEHRKVTLMFTDLAGFTTISETLSAEKVTQLLNRHFTAMTDIVGEHHGTVAHFIGDAIFAFWGAPLPDDDQAFRAVSAAIEMQKAMVKMRLELAAEGLPEIHMRVGVHCGSPVIGNLGSEKRLEYTAIGDDVNLASRLEGENKRFGTGILVSADVVLELTDRIPMRLLGPVVVKGRSKAVDVHTPCDQPHVIDLTSRAIALFRDRQWDAAQALFQELLQVVPGDVVSELYLADIEINRSAPPDADWAGESGLDKRKRSTPVPALQDRRGK